MRRHKKVIKGISKDRLGETDGRHKGKERHKEEIKRKNRDTFRGLHLENVKI